MRLYRHRTFHDRAPYSTCAGRWWGNGRRWRNRRLRQGWQCRQGRRWRDPTPGTGSGRRCLSSAGFFVLQSTYRWPRRRCRAAGVRRRPIAKPRPTGGGKRRGWMIGLDDILVRIDVFFLHLARARGRWCFLIGHLTVFIDPLIKFGRDRCSGQGQQQ